MILSLHAVTATAQGTEHYYVGNKKVELAPSNNFSAYKVESTASAAAISRKLDGAAQVEQSPVVADEKIVLIQKAGPMSPGAARSSIENLPEVNQVVSEPPVFNVAGADQVLVNEFLVQFKSGVSQADAEATLLAAGSEVKKKPSKIAGRYVVTFKGVDELTALNRSNDLHQKEGVEFSQPNFIRVFRPKPQSGLAPPTCPPSAESNDTFFSCQWDLNNAGGAVGAAGADIRALRAWAVSRGSPTVVVAIIDEGVDTGHPDLVSQIVTPYDAVDGDNDQTPQARDGHGTACAGIVAAVAGNGAGVAGIAPNVKIMPVRIARGNGLGGWITNDAQIEDGIRTAVDQGAQVLSNSWGGGSESNPINSAIDYALDRGRTVVFAAGNYSTSVSYPASLSASRAVIAVSATNEWDEFKTSSSRDGETGWGSNFGPEVSVAAPGVHIYTTDIRGPGGYDPSDYTATFNGTSSATPLVAGVAALLLSQNPNLTPSQVRDIIQRSAQDLGATGRDDFFGYGRLDAERALAMASNPPVAISRPVTPPSLSPTPTVAPARPNEAVGPASKN